MRIENMATGNEKGRLYAGLGLVLITMVYNTVEAILAIYTGINDHSVALESFGLDSVIEWFLGAVLMWRLAIEAWGVGGDRLSVVERQANWWAGVVFWVLAGLILAGSTLTLWTQTVSQPGWLGIGLAVASVIIMPIVATAKWRIGDAIGSSALKAEASCTWVCAYMSATLLTGLVLTRYLGWWWADPIAALGILYWVIREGQESFERASGHASCCGCAPG